MSQTSETQLKTLLNAFFQQGGSDLFITAEAPVSHRLDGQITPLTQESLTSTQSQSLTLALMTQAQQEQFHAQKELNFSYRLSDSARFRVNAFFQQEQVGCVIRRIASRIPTLSELNLPSDLGELVMAQRGLILVVGATGSGKSTTLASMIDHRNRHQSGHIITIEDPIEFVHRHQKSLLTQREVGVDTESFNQALENTLRQAPDVILLGEIRAQETMSHAINFAETGHLCLSTLHANNAHQALDRIINFFPQAKRDQVLMDLSLNLKAIVSQRLIPSESGGRVAALEVLYNTPYVSELIFEGRVNEIKAAMENSQEPGMQTFDHALFDLYETDQISYENALRHADAVNDLRLKIKLRSQKPLPEALQSQSASLSIKPDA
ncbi:PilT/PilU family type 4a pilus ATPase [Hydrogenovibrio halophilus]|uniref:PilT/PilU family type 4a pilus ATPase n=1 Tax=Hydrogenovibrio halophilus TaxID=373391 RepID=UPI0003682FCD|nr:PilT/PilU family type 4a pilus ATPase [Hydrogenovibrio halophilus]